MRALLWNGAASACEAARLRASLALDGDLEEIQLLLLQRHLDRCPECPAVVGAMRGVTERVRSAPHEVRPPARAVGRRPVQSLPWASIGVAVAALALGAATLPQPPGPTGAGGEAPRLAAPPPPLPIGQRSAGDDFLPASGSSRRS